MTADKPDAPDVDGYEHCDKATLIKLLRSRDAEAADTKKKIETLQKEADAKSKTLNEISAELEDLKKYSENLRTTISNIFIKKIGEGQSVAKYFEDELKLGGNVVFYLAKDVEEELARRTQELNEHLAQSHRSSKYNPNSQSEKNKGQPRHKDESPGEQDDELVRVTMEKPLDELPDTYTPGDDGADDGPEEAPPPSDGLKAQTDGQTQAAQPLPNKSKKKKRDLGKKLEGQERLNHFEHLKEKSRGKSIESIAKECTGKIIKHRQSAQNKDSQAALPDKGLTLDDVKGLEQLNIYASMDVQEGRDGNLILRKWCANCGRTHEFKVKPSPKRQQPYLAWINDRVVYVSSGVYLASCSKCGATIEINPVEPIPRELVFNPVSNLSGFMLKHDVERLKESIIDAAQLSDQEQEERDGAKFKTTEIARMVEQIVSNPFFKDSPKSKLKQALDELTKQRSVTVEDTPEGSKLTSTPGADDSLSRGMCDALKDMAPPDGSRGEMIALFRKVLEETRNIPSDIKKRYERGKKLPCDASAAERMKMCEQLQYDAGLCYAKHGTLECFLDLYGVKLEEAGLRDQIANGSRLQKDWALKLIWLANKCAPLAVSKQINPQDALLKLEDGTEVINPYAFDARSYACSPLFIKSSVTVGLMVHMSAMLTELSLPKSRVHRFFTDLGLHVEKQQVISWMIGFARAFMRPAAAQIRKEVLEHSEGVLMDETTIKVDMTPQEAELLSPGLEKTGKAPKGGLRLSQLWTVNTSWTSPIKANFCVLSPTRNHSVPVEILKDSSPGKIKTLTTDGYTGYQRALKVLEEEYGIKIQHTPCLTHLRRPLHQYLEDAGLLKIYNGLLVPRDCDFFADFAKNLREIRKNGFPEGFETKLTELNERNSALLTVYYLINLLYAIDSAVVVQCQYDCKSDRFKEALKRARQCCSAPVVDAIYDIVCLSLKKFPDMVDVYDKDGKITYKASGREGRFLLAALRVEPEIRTFIEHPEVELCESVCERTLRTSVLAKRTFYCLRSGDGGQAFCDFQTVFGTCRMNGVSLLHYCSWLVANVKLRMSKLEEQGRGDATIYAMPHKTDKTQGKKKVRIGIYHPDNHTMYDKVDMRHLMPYDYAALLKDCKPAEADACDKIAC